MTQEEFIEKMRELDPFYHEKEVPLDILYSHFEIVVEEMGRLEDIEDNTVQLKAHIDFLNQKIAKLGDLLGIEKLQEADYDKGKNEKEV